MPLKLGELLIREKIITAGQLEEALKNHVVYGIKLGSSLVEMGYVDEEQLSVLLSEKLKAPRVDRHDVMSASKECIQLISGDFARRNRIIPFHQVQKRLSVAMSDPTNFMAIDEIGFLTGKVVKVYITPDVVISRALAKFYNISEAESRYHQIAVKARKPSAPPAPQTVVFQIPSESGELLQVVVPAEFKGFGDQQELTEPEAASAIQNPAPAGESDEVPAAVVTPDPAPEPEPAPEPNYSVDQISIDFANVNSREELADVFIKYLGFDFEICGLFIVHGGDAVGWRGMARGQRLPAFEKFNLNLAKVSVLQEVVASRMFYRGALSENPCNRQILYLLKAAAVTPFLVLPVIMQDEIAAVVMVSVYEKNFRWRLMELQKLVRKMSLVFEKLIIKHKILMT